MRIVFMGTPEFAVPSLKALCDNGYDVVGVFTQPDRPKGRGNKVIASPVKQVAVEKGIPVFQPVTVKDGKAVTHDGAIAGSTLHLLDGVKNLVAFAGIPFEHALYAATAAPAKAMGLDGMIGELSVGKRADMLLLDEPATMACPKTKQEILDAVKKINKELAEVKATEVE